MLGHGDEQDQLLPKEVEAFAGQRVVAVSAGEQHSHAITANGAVWSWGNGGEGRLGHGDQQAQLLPKEVEAFAGRRAIAVSAGSDHSLALTADGSVWSWGYGAKYGKLGHGDAAPAAAQEDRDLDGQARRRRVGWNMWHSLALSAEGTVWSCGSGGFGKLGHGDLQSQPRPKKIEALADQRVVTLSAGTRHSLALTANGAVFTWGEGKDGCLGAWATERTCRTSAAAQEGRGVVAGLRSRG